VVTSSGIPDAGYFTFRPFGQYLTADKLNYALNGATGSIF
jgi:hypothetical protein